MTRIRRLSGVLAGGLVALAAVFVVAAVVAARRETPGPGASALVVHVLAAVAAVALQVRADRRAGASGTAAAVGVVVLTGAVLTGQWLL